MKTQFENGNPQSAVHARSVEAGGVRQRIHRVTLTDQQSGKSTGASIVHVYDRDEMPMQTDAPTVRNLALVVFATIPQASRVVVAVTDRIVPIFLFEAAHLWFDVKGCPVTMRRAD